MKTSKILFAALTSAALAFGTAAPAFALTATEAANQTITHEAAVNNVGNTEYWLQLASNEGGLIVMSVDVPVRVNLAVQATGEFITPTAFKNVIENKSEFPVDVTAMQVTGKNGFTNIPATGFATSGTSNAFKGSIASVTLSDSLDSVVSTEHKVAFKKFDEFNTNSAWRMEASDNNARSGDDCLFIQIDGALNNVAGKYFTSAVNVFDITYTFAAASADLGAPGGDLTD